MDDKELDSVAIKELPGSEEEIPEREYGPTTGFLGWINNHNHQVGSAILAAFTVVVLVATWSLPFGSIARPGSGLWPMVVAVVTAVLGIVEVIVAKEDEESFTWKGLARVASLIVALLAFPVLFQMIGFIIPATLLVVFMMRVLSKESFVKSLIVGIVTSALVYFVFAELLSVRLAAFG